jgi:hypothetical protein
MRFWAARKAEALQPGPMWNPANARSWGATEEEIARTQAILQPEQDKRTQAAVEYHELALQTAPIVIGLTPEELRARGNDRAAAAVEAAGTTQDTKAITAAATQLHAVELTKIIGREPTAREVQDFMVGSALERQERLKAEKAADPTQAPAAGEKPAGKAPGALFWGIGLLGLWALSR